jgi:AraC family transcriptional regulator, positive regulator of tynA and feaB
MNSSPIGENPAKSTYNAEKWERLLAEQFLPGQVMLADAGPGGSLAYQAQINRLRIAQMSVWPQSIAHTTIHLGALSDEDRSSVIAHVIIEGNGYIEQCGKVFPFQSGDISFRNLAEPSRVVFETPGEFFAIRLPASVLIAHHSYRTHQARLKPKIIQGATMLPDVTQRLLSNMALGDEAMIKDWYISFALPWLIAAAYHSDNSQSNRMREPNELRWQQLLAYLEAHLFDPDAMSASACAQAIGISERYLYKQFSLRGQHFSKMVLERRLDAAHVLLKSVAFKAHSIASIAYQCGFKDPAHFSRLFRQRYGISPRQCRDAD